MHDDVEVCPKCGDEFDPMRDLIVACVRCGLKGSTACCNPRGPDSICEDCEDTGLYGKIRIGVRW